MMQELQRLRALLQRVVGCWEVDVEEQLGLPVCSQFVLAPRYQHMLQELQRLVASLQGVVGRWEAEVEVGAAWAACPFPTPAGNALWPRFATRPASTTCFDRRLCRNIRPGKTSSSNVFPQHALRLELNSPYG
eukprot:TRINITY_DN10322_c0_g1_i8.p2 TRINITY_DN10322_c0_g1~~TRINITY_DN10322_c0_g1_i8.p2  ORF type:complete len:133 (-),score=29.95 TRINITY_DN10322_c0_g1_i8:391-789(-)